MADSKPQSLANHRRFVPMYHGVLFLILVVNLVWSCWHLYKVPGVAATMNLLVAIGLGILFLYARTFPLAASNQSADEHFAIRVFDADNISIINA